MNDIVIKFFLGLISILIIKEYLGTIFIERDSINKKIFCGINLFFSIGLEIYNGIPFFNLLFNLIFVFLISLVGYIGSKRKKAIAAFSMIVIWAISEIIIGYLAMFFHMYFILPKFQGSILSKLVTLFFVMLIKKILVKYIPQNENRILTRQWWLLLIFPVCSIGIIYFIFFLVEENNNSVIIFGALLSCCFFLPFNLGIFKIYDSMSREFELRQQNTIYEENLRLFAREMKLKEESMNSKDLMHDMKKHFLVIKSMALKLQTQDIIEYLETLSEHYTGEQNLINSGNFVVDTLINSKYMIIKNQDISHEINVLIPSEIKIDDADMCILLGNALDNAYEAIEKAEVKKIHISIIYELGKLKIGIKNTYAGDIKLGENNMYLSTKKDNKNHGIGLKLMKKVVEKYNGFLSVDHDKEYFIFIATLNESEYSISKSIK